MSWRKFITLVSGLTGDSLFIHTLSEEKKKKKEVLTETPDILRDIQIQLAKRK